jgi:hypothetical protein
MPLSRPWGPLHHLLTPSAAAGLFALTGCNGEIARDQAAMRADLARLARQVARLETENARLSKRLDEVALAVAGRAEARPAVERPEESSRGEPEGPSTGAAGVGEADAGPAKGGGAVFHPFTREVQRALKRAGYDPGPVDGKTGPLTTRAIKEFQEDNGLRESGMADPDTWALLKRHLGE